MHGGDRSIRMVFGLVEARCVGPISVAHQLGQHLFPALVALFLHGHPAFHDPGQAFFAVADDEQIDERGQHFRVLGPGASRDYQRVIEGPIFGMQRDAAQVEHGQNVGVTNLVLKAEADQIELRERRESLQAVERKPALAEQGFEIEPRGEGALRRPTAGRCS